MNEDNSNKTCIEDIPLNNADIILTGRWFHPSPFGIIKRMTYFLWFKVCFEMQSGYTFIFLTYNILREVVELFFSDFFQSSFPDG